MDGRALTARVIEDTCRTLFGLSFHVSSSPHSADSLYRIFEARRRKGIGSRAEIEKEGREEQKAAIYQVKMCSCVYTVHYRLSLTVSAAAGGRGGEQEDTGCAGALRQHNRSCRHDVCRFDEVSDDDERAL